MIRTILKFLYKLRNKFWRLIGVVTVGVRIIAIRDKQILLVRHTYLDGWFLPGGGVLSNETLEDAARRELFEETGVVLEKVTLIGIYTDFSEGRSDHKVLFSGVVIDKKNIISKEILETKYFPLHRLPDDFSNQYKKKIHDFLTDGYPKYGEW